MSYKPVVAVLGTNGFLGKPILEALQSPTFSAKYTLPIRALTRDKSKYEDTDLVKYYEIVPNDANSIAEALKGVDVFVNVGGGATDHGLVLEGVLKAGGVKLYIPSQFGTALSDASYLPILQGKVDHSAKARAEGLKTVDIYTSLFAAPGSFLYEVIAAIGFDKDSNTATFRGDPAAKFDISFLPDIGKSVASLSALEPSTLPDEIRISSDQVTQEEVLARYEKTHSVKVERKSISKEDALKYAKELLSTKGFDFADFFLYLQTFISQGDDKGLAFTKNDDELVNPGESLWKWTKFE
ncbi:unnamed protein product [Kuraishia capsulata CBS 1993]|uniref:NmrA-like domain-containing protein n=1 Tax=Kuraishia capsulata CBS 1993 TaxID=1382522 RepID=W6MIY9_9ASCO|nr:uncharacterized protein KUCA_T00002122001 [Kuraishia capsulata CBS 1993]CDK26151.1 unnamed protein product [Kuraishia capsulata CBS 1993]